MAFDPQRTTMTRTEAARAEIDVGLRSYMLRVYNYMCLGVAFTGAIAMMVATNESLVMSIASMFWVFFIAILGLGWMGPRLMMSKSVGSRNPSTGKIARVFASTTGVDASGRALLRSASRSSSSSNCGLIMPVP